MASPRVSAGAPARQTPDLANHCLKLSSLTGLQIQVCSVDSTPRLSSARNLLAPLPCCLHLSVEVGQEKWSREGGLRGRRVSMAPWEQLGTPHRHLVGESLLLVSWPFPKNSPASPHVMFT